MKVVFAPPVDACTANSAAALAKKPWNALLDPPVCLARFALEAHATRLDVIPPPGSRAIELGFEFTFQGSDVLEEIVDLRWLFPPRVPNCAKVPGPWGFFP